MRRFTCEEVARVTDHSLLHPAMTDAELEEGCQSAREWGVATVCVKPHFTARARGILDGSIVNAGTTIGFPHGGHAIAAKMAEAKAALRDGAQELDMVINIGKAKGHEWGYLEDEIGAIVSAAHDGGAVLKVIFENCYLQDEHKIRLCQVCGEVGADWVKTATGFAAGGATIPDLKLMRQYSPPHVQVKAAGGVRTLDGLLEVRALGVTRVGATRTGEMLDECKRRLGIS